MRIPKVLREDYMRFYNNYVICKKLVNNIIPDYEQKDYANGTTTFIIKNWRQIKNSIEELYSLSFLRNAIDNIYQTLSVYDRNLELPEITDTSYEIFVEKTRILSAKMKAVIELYESFGHKEVKNGIDIKMPDYKELADYIDALKDIDFVLSQCPYLNSVDEKIEFNNVDVGSTWLSFIVICGTGFYILNNLAKIVDKAIAIKSHIATYKQQAEMLEEIRQKNHMGSEVIDTFKEMKSITLKMYVSELKSEIGPLEDGEEEGKVEKCLEKLANLMNQGVEIYTSIDTPKEIKMLFPMSEDNKILSDDLVKLLEDKENEIK